MLHMLLTTVKLCAYCIQDGLSWHWTDD